MKKLLATLVSALGLALPARAAVITLDWQVDLAGDTGFLNNTDRIQLVYFNLWEEGDPGSPYHAPVASFIRFSWWFDNGDFGATREGEARVAEEPEPALIALTGFVPFGGHQYRGSIYWTLDEPGGDFLWLDTGSLYHFDEVDRSYRVADTGVTAALAGLSLFILVAAARRSRSGAPAG